MNSTSNMVIPTKDSVKKSQDSTAKVFVSDSLSSDGDLVMRTYHELGLRHPHETNVLEELKYNLFQLEDLHLRLRYVLGEISSVTNRTKLKG